MIGYLSGKIIDISETKIVIENGGIGYEVVVNSHTLSRLNCGNEIELHIVPEVREDAFELFGFESTQEKHFYKRLRNINGVGPRTASNLLSLTLPELEKAIETEDMKKLTSINGLGKKTAERLILELKRQLPKSLKQSGSQRDLDSLAVQALKNLGYKTNEINQVLSQLPKEEKTTEEVIKFFLQNV